MRESENVCVCVRVWKRETLTERLRERKRERDTCQSPPAIKQMNITFFQSLAHTHGLILRQTDLIELDKDGHKLCIFFFIQQT